jgi:hypothetical protein
MVAACSAAAGGDAETKMKAQRDAIAGAFMASKNGPPTVRFIWEKLDHFLDHVDRGRSRRLAEEREARTRARRDAGAPTRVAPVPFTTIPREQMTADLRQLFGPGWKARTR